MCELLGQKKDLTIARDKKAVGSNFLLDRFHCKSRNQISCEREFF